MVTIDSTLESIMQLDYNTREMLLEIVQKRQIEERRDQIGDSAKKSIKDYHAGKTVALNADEVIQRLNSL